MAKAKSPRATSDWGTPDPRNADAYPTRATSLPQWAWEFLRRRTDYREQWQKVVQPFIKDDGKWDFEAEDRGREGNAFFYTSPLVSLGAEFRISPSFGNFYLDPRSGCPPVFDHRAVELIGAVSSTAWFELPRIAFVFDVRSPPDPQFAYARQKFMKGAREWSLSHDQKLPRRPTRHIQKYLKYLRLLDFKENRTPDKEIGSYLFPCKSGEELRDMISKNRNAARRCQRDYLSIAFGSPPFL
jgi:hypothetical protein